MAQQLRRVSALVPLLTDPAGHGIDGPAFDVVIPSLPGYGFSDRPARTGVNTRYTAGLWHRLMRGLGYKRYGAQGGDFGAGVATFMALEDPKPMIGLRLSNLESRRTPARVPGRCRRQNARTSRSTGAGPTSTGATARSSPPSPRRWGTA